MLHFVKKVQMEEISDFCTYLSRRHISLRSLWCIYKVINKCNIKAAEEINQSNTKAANNLLSLEAAGYLLVQEKESLVHWSPGQFGKSFHFLHYSLLPRFSQLAPGGPSFQLLVSLNVWPEKWSTKRTVLARVRVGNTMNVLSFQYTTCFSPKIQFQRCYSWDLCLSPLPSHLNPVSKPAYFNCITLCKQSTQHQSPT